MNSFINGLIPFPIQEPGIHYSTLEKGEFQMYQRLFQVEQEWCMIHYPERPNGFAVMIIGDYGQDVDEKSSFWSHHEFRKKWVRDMTDKGYIVFYSNLYGANWGNKRAVRLAHRLYQYVKRTEIINPRIHILIEGMGGLVLKDLYPLMKDEVRSIVMLSPCVSLRNHLEQEKEQKFFHKKLIREIRHAFSVTEDQWPAFIESLTESDVFHTIPMPLYIVQPASLNRYKNQVSLILDIYRDRLENGLMVDLFYVLPEKRMSLGRKFTSYFAKHESDL